MNHGCLHRNRILKRNRSRFAARGHAHAKQRPKEPATIHSALTAGSLTGSVLTGISRQSEGKGRVRWAAYSPKVKPLMAAQAIKRAAIRNARTKSYAGRGTRLVHRPLADAPRWCVLCPPT